MSTMLEFQDSRDSASECSAYSDSTSDCSELQDVSTYRWLFEPSVVNHSRCLEIGSEKPRPNSVGDRLIVSSTDLSGDLRLIMEMPNLCDVKFLVGKDREPVYGVKAVLATRSRCFHNILRAAQLAEEEEKRQRKKNVSSKIKRFLKSRKSKERKDKKHLCVPVQEFDWCTFQRIVLYLHTGKININQDSVIGVLAAADAYNLNDLRTQCDQFASKLISISTVLRLLMATERYSHVKSVQKVISEILSFVSNNAEAVLNLPEFEFVTKNCAELILTSNSMQIADDLKWEATLRWARRHCRGQNLDTLRATIKPFLSYINFKCVPVRKLTLEVRPLRVLDDKVISNAIDHQAKSSLVTRVDSPDVIQPGFADMIDPHSRDESGLDIICANGPYNMMDLTMFSSEMDTTSSEYQSFFNENDLLDELLEGDSDLSAIFDVSMASA